MSYSNLIGDEVYLGSPCYEEFHTIVDYWGAGDNVELHLERNGSVKSVSIPKQDLDKYLKEEYVEFIAKDSKGLKLQVLVSCGKQAESWAESF